MKVPVIVILSAVIVGCTGSADERPPAAQATSAGQAFSARSQWTPDEATSWYEGQPWLVGSNFAPSTAINQLEMWQADTFDIATIDRELRWAAQLGFNSMRVFLHHLLWQQDAEGFLSRIEQFLDVAEKHRIGVMFVLLDGVWDPHPALGKQRAPKPGLHNSGWVQSPGVEILGDPGRHDELKPYIQGVIAHFRTDRRVHVWDIFNEPDNPNASSYGKLEPENKAELALRLLRKTYAWAREVGPSQPITAGVWRDSWDPDEMSPIVTFMLEESDIITFHSYDPLPDVQKRVESLRRYKRPILCTEYMARPRESTFDPIMGYFKEQKVGAYNWGFVSGKSQTVYPWDSWKKPYTREPSPWFHDVFRSNGEPYHAEEVAYIKRITASDPEGRKD
ncbi:MAG: cellulase family glycosylhydrolase [Luteitalea sp.]|nr:cellulase family glycosylhydrolase [Luteitalea sp.]